MEILHGSDRYMEGNYRAGGKQRSAISAQTVYFITL